MGDALREPVARPARRKKKRSAASRDEPSGLVNVRATDARALAQAKRMLTAAASGMLVAVALVATGETTVGPWICVVSMALGIGAAHTIGRCGPDPGTRRLSS